MAEEYGERVVFFGVSNNDTVEDGRAYAEDYDVPYDLAHSPEVWDRYEVPYQPVTIVIGRDGGIASRIDGPVTYEQLKQIIEQEL